MKMLKTLVGTCGFGFHKNEPRPFNFVFQRALWHYYNKTPRVSKILLADYDNPRRIKFRAGR